MIQQRGTAAVCSRCGTEDVLCEAEYYTTGGDMEHVEFKHTCRKCGYREETIQQGCYGYDNSYRCSLRHADDGSPGSSAYWRVMLEQDDGGAYVVRGNLSEQAAENTLRQYQREGGPRYWKERM